MHEFSLVQALLEQVERLRLERGLGPATAVRVGIGALAGVEPDLFRSAFTVATGSVDLEINTIPLEAYCRLCNLPFAVEQFRFVCPVCAARQVQVTRGDAVILESVTFTTGDEE